MVHGVAASLPHADCCAVTLFAGVDMIPFHEVLFFVKRRWLVVPGLQRRSKHYVRHALCWLE